METIPLLKRPPIQTINNKDIISQRASFQEFIKAQNDEEEEDNDADGNDEES